MQSIGFNAQLMTNEKFQEIVDNSQPHKVFELNWSKYYSIDFADTFLPKADGHTAKALHFFDGAKLLDNLSKSHRKLLELSKNDKLIGLITYTYPKSVEAEYKKDRVQAAKNEICTFIEVSKNDDIDVHFKFGYNFKNELASRKINVNSIENSSFKTTISEFQKHFNNKLSHHNMMHFILKTINVENQFEQEIEQDVKDQQKGTNIVKVNAEGTTLMQVRHELVNVGESIAQVKYNTSATVTQRGTVVVTQFKQEITSRGEDVWYFNNALGTFEGTLDEAKEAFPDVDFSDVQVPPAFQRKHPEFGNMPIWPVSKPLEWEPVNEYDAEKNNGKPTTWEKWADATQTALDVVGLIPGVGEIADCLNGVISLARGDYAGAALSFVAMIPFIGSGATITKQARKVSKSSDKVEGVYDLIVKNTDEVKGYVGQSKDTYKRIENHFNPKRGKLAHTVLEEAPTIYKMPGSLPREREIYEQFVILQKYQGQINTSKNPLAKLLNKVNPMGGRFNLKTPQGRKIFREEALKIAKKYNLPTEFDPPNF